MTYRPYSYLTSAHSNSFKRTNNTTNPLTLGTPVYTDNAGEIAPITDVSSEAQILALTGITNEDINATSEGLLVAAGIIKNVDASGTLGFDYGDFIYLSGTGYLTNVLPSIGVTDGTHTWAAGEYVIKLGVITKSDDSSTDKDLMVDMHVIGRL